MDPEKTDKTKDGQRTDKQPSSPEIRMMPPFPATLDLVVIDGQFMQCISADPKDGVSFVLLGDRSKGINITSEEWEKYEYEAPPGNVIDARGLVEEGLMTDEQLEQVYWGPEEDGHPLLKEVVTFFGTFTKRT